ncbi:MAG: DUF1801 domain-containing protein [Balneola sp.]|nr:MAG: DUF1801 domain-containing protein [Balneola sp.]
MNKFQNLNFSSLGDFLDYLPDNELEIVEELRALVYECIPDCKEKLSYNVPFFSRNRTICFIWPGSVPWGTIKEGVILGFSRGNLLSDYAGYLEKGTRKSVYTKTFLHVDEIDPQLIRDYLFEALEIDSHSNKKS